MNSMAIEYTKLFSLCYITLSSVSDELLLLVECVRDIRRLCVVIEQRAVSAGQR